MSSLPPDNIPSGDARSFSVPQREYTKKNAPKVNRSAYGLNILNGLLMWLVFVLAFAWDHYHDKEISCSNGPLLCPSDFQSGFVIISILSSPLLLLFIGIATGLLAVMRNFEGFKNYKPVIQVSPIFGIVFMISSATLIY